MTEDEKQQRANARRNRDRILAVAHEAFADDPETSLNAIAKRAEVGAGTLYRHFPTREDLILAVYQRDIERLSADVDRMLAEQSPVEAFATWFRRLASDIRVKHGLGDALNTAAAQHVISQTYPPVTAAITTLLEAGAADGSFRSGLDPSDVLVLMGFLWRVPDTAEGRDMGARMLDVVLAGLRP